MKWESVGMSSSAPLLLVTPCDPGNCHIYFGVQLRALPTAVALARHLRRTLVLPPFEWYENQAQDFVNAFRTTPAGRIPRFTPWSQLFDSDALRAGGIDVIDLADAPAHVQTIDRAFLHTSSRTGAAPTQQSVASDERLCKPGRDGLQANLTWDATGRAVGAVELYGQRFSFGAPLRCTELQLTSTEVVEALESWIGDAPTAAVFNVGHHVQTKVGSAGAARALLDRSLRPHPHLDREAARFVKEVMQPVHAHQKWVAVHWRHGDYVAYKLLTPMARLIERVEKALATLDCDQSSTSCSVFLMTNCRNVTELSELSTALRPTVPVIRYEPSEPFFATEGARLVIEQSVASRADLFVNSPRSAVSEYIDTLRRSGQAKRKEKDTVVTPNPKSAAKAEL